MKRLYVLIFSMMLLSAGCSSDTPISSSFVLPAGTEISLNNQVSTFYSDKELIFELTNVPDTKKDTDFSDFIEVTLIAGNGKKYKATKIVGINSSRSDVIATCSNTPNNTKVASINIRVLKEIRGNNIRWWNGNLL